MKKESYSTKKRSELLESLRSAKKDLCTALLRPARSPADVKKRQVLRRKVAHISTALTGMPAVAKDGKIVDDTGTGSPSQKQAA